MAAREYSKCDLFSTEFLHEGALRIIDLMTLTHMVTTRLTRYSHKRQ
jgi:hypothetical protein